MRLPEGMRANLIVYLKTEIDGIQADLALTIEGFSSIPELPHEIDVESLARRLKLDVPLDFTKTRLMTATEITEYRRAQEEGRGDA